MRVWGFWQLCYWVFGSLGCGTVLLGLQKFAYENLVQDKFPHFYVISVTVEWVSNLETYNEVCHTTEHMVHNSLLLFLALVRTSHILSSPLHTPHLISSSSLILSYLPFNCTINQPTSNTNLLFTLFWADIFFYLVFLVVFFYFEVNCLSSFSRSSLHFLASTSKL